jgi:hypothetical protein
MVQVTTRDEEEKPQLDLKDKKVNEHLRKVNEKTGHMATSMHPPKCNACFESDEL